MRSLCCAVLWSACSSAVGLSLATDCSRTRVHWAAAVRVERRSAVELLAALRCARRRRQVVYRQGDESTSLYFVLSGAVQVPPARV